MFQPPQGVVISRPTEVRAATLYSLIVSLGLEGTRRVISFCFCHPSFHLDTKLYRTSCSVLVCSSCYIYLPRQNRVSVG